MRNRGNSTVKIPFNGIERSRPSNTDSYGGCNEIINARLRDGVWRPITPKKFIETIPDCFDVFQHTVLADGEYIVLNDQNHLIFYSNGVYDPTKLDITLDAGESIIDAIELGGFFTFTTNQRHINIFWGGSSYEEKEYAELNDFNPVATLLESTTAIRGKVDTIRELYDIARDVELDIINNFGTVGVVMVRFAIKLTDGRYVYQTAPTLLNQRLDKVTHRYVGEFELFKDAVLEDDGFGVENTHSKLAFSLTQIDIDFLNNQNVESICICATRPINNLDGFDISDIEEPDFDYTTLSADNAKTKLEEEGFLFKVNTAPDGYKRVYVFPYNKVNDPNNAVDDGNYYILKEIPKNELVVGTTVIEEDLDYSNLELLSIDSTRYNERLKSGELEVYNKRSHLFNYEREMVSLDTFVEDYFEFKTGASTFVLADYYAEITVFENGVENKITKLIGTASNTTEYLGFKTNYVGYGNINATKLRIWAIPSGIPPSGTDNRSEIVLDFKKHPTLNLVYIDNYNDTTHLFDIISEELKLLSTDINQQIDTTIYDGVVVNDKDIILSDINYPLTYDSINSYSFGDGKLIGVAAPTAALSEGQFGSFPLYAFTSGGVWVLSAGSGDVIYSSTVPVSREVAISRDGIDGTELGISFLTRSGLVILAGSTSTKLSERLRGKPIGLLSGNVEYQLNLGKDDIPEDSTGLHRSFPTLWEYVDDVDFLDYIDENTIVGYSYGKDFEEIIISNPSFNYSYVFELTSKSFYKITSRWDRIRTNYPGILGHVDNGGDIELYELSQEESSGYSNILIETTPQMMNTERFKKVFRNTLRGYLKLHKNDDIVNPDNPINPTAKTKIASMSLFVSEDGYNWTRYGDIQTNNDTVDIHILGGVSNQLHFKYVIVGQLDKDSNISNIDLDVRIDAIDTME